MKLYCPTCNREIPAADINIRLAAAKCATCNTVFQFQDQLEPVSAPRSAALPVPAPKKFIIEDFGSDLTIRWRWYSHAVWALLFFCLFWDGFLIFWYGMMFFAGKNMRGEAGWFWLLPILFPLLHVAVGVGLTYFVLCSFINRTVIRVTGGELTVRHGPLPWGGNRTVSTFDVTQLYCTEKVRSNRRGYSTSFELNALLSDGEKVNLLTAIEELDQALFLEQKLEQHLKIEDQRVPGEVGK